MNVESLTNFWPLIDSLLQEIWAITEPHIEEAAIQQHLPMELYYYSEFGLEIFSKQEFQKRDPYTNPEVFDRVFVTLHFKGWIELLPDEKYLVTEKAHEAARTLVQAGDLYLTPFESKTKLNLNRLATLLKQIVLASSVAPEPAEKWAMINRFHVADQHSPWIVQIREYLMDLFAFRDDCRYAAAHPHFGRGGIIWIALGALWKNDTVTAEQLAESMPSRGYDVHHYDVALQAAVQLDWAHTTNIPGQYRITQQGRTIREQAEQLTNKSFFTPWSVLTKNEIYEFSNLLLKLKDQLNSFRKAK
jgi:hypothetical protein